MQSACRDALTIPDKKDDQSLKVPDKIQQGRKTYVHESVTISKISVTESVLKSVLQS